MELKDSTIQVLKNFSNINPNIVINQGSEIRTISEARSIFAAVSVQEQFPIQFGIYDLNEFLGALNLVDRPNLQFEDNYVVISDTSGRSSVRYYYSDPDMLTTPTKSVKSIPPDVTFTLDNDTMNKIKRAASALGHDQVSITPSNGAVKLSIVDVDNSTSNTFSIEVIGDYPEGADFNLIMNISNLKMIAGDYEVGLSSKLISHFKNKSPDVPVEYWIALEKTSTYR
jgi:hypothetical protein